MSRRMQRVEEMLRTEISLLVQMELKDPRLGFVTITDTSVTPDLRCARVFVSVMGTQEEQQASLKALQSARGFLRSELSRRAHLKTVPELEFRLDDAVSRGHRIFELLQEVRRSEGRNDGDEDRGSEDDGTRADGQPPE